MKQIRLSITAATLITACLFALTVSAADVRDSGAKGDGKTDDTAAIQKAVNGGGGIRFEKGVYRITKTIVIELDKTGFVSLIGDGTARIVMAGAGPAFKFVGTHEGSAAPSDFKANVWERQRTPMVDALEIIGDHAEADGIEATGTMQITISRVVIREARHGIHLTVRNRNVLIADCHIYHNRGIGVFYDNVNLHQSNIVGSHISYNAGGGIVSRGGNVRNVHIGTCDIESNMSANSPPTANILLDSTGGCIGEVAITGCTIQHNNPSPGAANIRVIGQGTEAALAKRIGNDKTQEGNITIGDNVLSDVKINIHLQNARGVTITGNTFWMGYEHDILVEDSFAVVVGPNNFDRNPRYDYGNTRDAKNGIVFLNSKDCILNGLYVNGVQRKAAAVLIEKCDRFNISNCSIFDNEGVGLLLQDVTNTRVSGCMIRDDRKERTAAPSLKLTGGNGNWVTQNLLANGQEVDAKAAKVEGNYDGK